MSQDQQIGAIQPGVQNQVDKMAKNPHYQKVQQQLKEKSAKQTKVQKSEKTNMDITDKVNITNNFVWQKDALGNMRIKPEEERNPQLRAKEEKFSASKILRSLGYHINLTEKVESLKDLLKILYIESKSHNLILSKFAEVRYGMTLRTLAMLGVSSKEIKQLQKEALGESISDNIDLFTENEYNSIMFTLFGTNTKEKKSAVIFEETRNQLMAQMRRLGQKSYYSKERVLTIQKEQYEKIREELIRERSNIEYMREFSA